jgi:hypothetical protein
MDPFEPVLPVHITIEHREFATSFVGTFDPFDPVGEAQQDDRAVPAEPDPTTGRRQFLAIEAVEQGHQRLA